MKRFRLATVFLMTVLTFIATQSKSIAAEWTIIVYMNGNNGLEQDTLINLNQMARVGSTSDVNIVTQVARLSAGNVVRGLVQKRDPATQSPIDDLESLGDLDMGVPDTLSGFVRWAIQNYPARRYAVIVWGHGSGWRKIVQQSQNSDRTAANGAIGSPFRGVAFDERHNNHFLYNKDVQSVLEGVVSDGLLNQTESGKFELVAFDACLMGMIETAYSLRNSSRYMVGSEELIPAEGFPYDMWLGELVQRPNIDGEELSTQIIDAYSERYSSRDPSTTLSGIDVAKAEKVAKAISLLGDSLSNTLPGSASQIRSLRENCKEYGALSDGVPSLFHHVDLGCIVSGVSKANFGSSTNEAANSVLLSLNDTVLHNYVGDYRKDFGGSGLSIYFAIDKSSYIDDNSAAGGYNKANTDHPVDFVSERGMNWADFLHKYWKYEQR